MALLSISTPNLQMSLRPLHPPGQFPREGQIWFLFLPWAASPLFFLSVHYRSLSLSFLLLSSALEACTPRSNNCICVSWTTTTAASKSINIGQKWMGCHSRWSRWPFWKSRNRYRDPWLGPFWNLLPHSPSYLLPSWSALLIPLRTQWPSCPPVSFS